MCCRRSSARSAAWTLAARPKLLAGQMALQLRHADIDAILETGLHAWITRFLEESAELSGAISRAYFEAH
jgi:uncharacterized alpha-E superfamily protein